MAVMRTPARLYFSALYSTYGISGAYGLSDQGICEESDMVEACAVGQRASGETDRLQPLMEGGRFAGYKHLL